MTTDRPKADWLMREVVDEEKRPYDTDYYGNILYTEFDILECGHKIRRFKTNESSSINRGTNAEGERAKTRYLKMNKRRCKECERETDEQGQ